MPLTPHQQISRRLLAASALIAGVLIIACGSFAPRPARAPGAVTNTPGATVEPATVTPTATLAQTATPEATPTPDGPTSTPTRGPKPTATQTPIPPTSLLVGQPARVVAAGGLNVREKPDMDSQRVGKMASGAWVQILEGPLPGTAASTSAGTTYRWWKVRDRRNLEGWVADGDGESEWLSPQVGTPRPVNRPVVRGDVVAVTTQEGKVLTVRFEAGVDSVVARRLRAGARLEVIDGPVDVDGFRWWLVQDQEGRQGWAAEGDAETRWLTPVE